MAARHFRAPSRFGRIAGPFRAREETLKAIFTKRFRTRVDDLPQNQQSSVRMKAWCPTAPEAPGLILEGLSRSYCRIAPFKYRREHLGVTHFSVDMMPRGPFPIKWNGVCICRGTKDVALSDEHAVPYLLCGSRVLTWARGDKRAEISMSMAEQKRVILAIRRAFTGLFFLPYRLTPYISVA